MFLALAPKKTTRLWLLAVLGSLVWCIGTIACHAQDNYEIQVSGSETVPPRTTMVELHSNFVFQGSKTTQVGVIPTEHELEIQSDRKPRCRLITGSSHYRNGNSRSPAKSLDACLRSANTCFIHSAQMPD